MDSNLGQVQPTCNGMIQFNLQRSRLHFERMETMLHDVGVAQGVATGILAFNVYIIHYTAIFSLTLCLFTYTLTSSPALKIYPSRAQNSRFENQCTRTYIRSRRLFQGLQHREFNRTDSPRRVESTHATRPDSNPRSAHPTRLCAIPVNPISLMPSSVPTLRPNDATRTRLGRALDAPTWIQIRAHETPI
ncbi:hypothetical protein C8R43DRAFT_1001686 [Mycena crocata]|nr:hypothetical protein C8R43DRAFT_1001686 [Mycena crocata]